MIDVGDKAPAFNGVTDGGGGLSLKELKGKKVVLYFYPKDATPGCTTEAQGFRDALDDFAKLGAEIVGVSKDSARTGLSARPMACGRKRRITARPIWVSCARPS